MFLHPHQKIEGVVGGQIVVRGLDPGSVDPDIEQRHRKARRRGIRVGCGDVPTADLPVVDEEGKDGVRGWPRVAEFDGRFHLGSLSSHLRLKLEGNHRGIFRRGNA